MSIVATLPTAGKRRRRRRSWPVPVLSELQRCELAVEILASQIRQLREITAREGDCAEWDHLAVLNAKLDAAWVERCRLEALRA